jgi:hypothetical protein
MQEDERAAGALIVARAAGPDGVQKVTFAEYVDRFALLQGIGDTRLLFRSEFDTESLQLRDKPITASGPSIA